MDTALKTTTFTYRTAPQAEHKTEPVYHITLITIQRVMGFVVSLIAILMCFMDAGTAAVIIAAIGFYLLYTNKCLLYSSKSNKN